MIRTKYKVLVIVVVFLMLTISSCKKEDPASPNINPSQLIDTSDINISFSQVLTLPSQVGATFGDISFGTNGFGVLSNINNNRIYITSDNGLTWHQSSWIPEFGFPIKCVAINNDGSEIFVGTTSGGDAYPGRYVILSTPTDSIIYGGNVSLYNVGNPNFNFVQAYYNWEGALWTAMGSNYNDDGNLLIKHSNSYSLWEDIDPLIGRKNYVSAIVRKRNGENIIGMFDYNGFQKAIFIKYRSSSQYEKLAILTSTPYQTELPISLSLSTDERLLAAYGGNVNNNRIYLSTSTLALWRKIIYQGIIGNFKSVKFDSNNYIWVCTDNGLYKSDTKIN